MYESRVRPTMSPPYVKADNFSGLMCWEHAALMQIWKRLGSTFKHLPEQLQPQHAEFVQAYFKLVADHKAVCQKFGGDEGGSLRFEEGKATDTLDKFARVRYAQIDPNRAIARCPHNYFKSS